MILTRLSLTLALLRMHHTHRNVLFLRFNELSIFSKIKIRSLEHLKLALNIFFVFRQKMLMPFGMKFR